MLLGSKMKLLVLLLIVGVATAIDETGDCTANVKEKCSDTTDIRTTKCNAMYGAYRHHVKSLQELINIHLTQSFEYLLLASHFGNFEANRAGFQKFFQTLSDTLWEDAMKLAHYNNKRGGNLNKISDELPGIEVELPDKESYAVNELEAMGMALDMHKRLATLTQKLHMEASQASAEYHDAEVAAFLQSEFLQRHSSTVREIAGHMSDLDKMFRTHDQSMAVYLFDQHLQ